MAGLIHLLNKAYDLEDSLYAERNYRCFSLMLQAFMRLGYAGEDVKSSIANKPHIPTVGWFEHATEDTSFIYRNGVMVGSVTICCRGGSTRGLLIIGGKRWHAHDEMPAWVEGDWV